MVWALRALKDDGRRRNRTRASLGGRLTPRWLAENVGLFCVVDRGNRFLNAQWPFLGARNCFKGRGISFPLVPFDLP